MKENEILKIRALENCTFTPGSFAKRFTRGMIELLNDKPDFILSDRQWYMVETLYHSYRSQIREHDRYCAICKALAKNEPLIDIVCPGCGYFVSLILRPRIKSINDDHVCPHCMQFRFSQFDLRRKK